VRERQIPDLPAYHTTILSTHYIIYMTTGSWPTSHHSHSTKHSLLNPSTSEICVGQM